MSDESVLMIDCIGDSAKNIPASTPKVAGYNTGSGGVEWTTADWNRFPDAGKVIICQDTEFSTWHTANVADVEPKAVTVAAFVAGATHREQLGWNTCAYVDKDNLAELVQACLAAKLTKIELWIGDWELNQEQAAAQLGGNVGGYQIVAIQWASPISNPHTIVPGGTQTLKEVNLDLSVTLPAWFPGKADVAAVPTAGATSITSVLKITGADNNVTSITIASADGGETWQFAK
jgi:hypothetical protein